MKTALAALLIAAGTAAATAATPAPMPPLDRLGVVIAIENDAMQVAGLRNIIRRAIEAGSEVTKRVRCRITRDC